MKALTVYFSASGVTAAAAEKLAKAAETDLYEIKPVVKYTKADLNWMDKKSRSSIEMNNKAMRPDIIIGDIDIAAYDVIYLGFPIWWYVAPTVINTFLEAYDFSGKKIVLFATSGGSEFGETLAELKPSAPGATFITSRLLNGRISDEAIAEVIRSGLE